MLIEYDENPGVYKEPSFDTIVVNVPVYDLPHDFPLRINNIWRAEIDLNVGQIMNWPIQDSPLVMDIKVVDAGEYTLKGKYGSKKLCDYVPHGVIPGKYGDYIYLEISCEGIITNWPEEPKFLEWY